MNKYNELKCWNSQIEDEKSVKSMKRDSSFSLLFKQKRRENNIYHIVTIKMKTNKNIKRIYLANFKMNDKNFKFVFFLSYLSFLSEDDSLRVILKFIHF